LRYFCPTLMERPEDIDKETFLKIMLHRRPEYAIVWDVTGQNVLEFRSRVWVVQYVVVKNDIIYFQESKHFARRAKVLLNLKEIIQVNSDDEWIKYLPADPRFHKMQYVAPELADKPTEIDLEDFINKMLKIRPPYAVLWNVTLDEVETMTHRVYVVAYMPIIGDTLYYSYGKFYARQIQKKFNIPQIQKITLQDPQLID
jgi:hypothetical protein